MKNQAKEAMKVMKTQKGMTVHDLGMDKPLLLAFIRHLGCIFCMEAMKDIAERRAEIESRGINICLVHMATNDVAESYFKEYNLEGIDHVSDPDCDYYEQFGLIKGNFNQLFGLQVWLRTAKLAYKDIAALKRKQIGDGLQMPGVFLIQNGQVQDSYIHKRASDRPDYLKLTSGFSSF